MSTNSSHTNTGGMPADEDLTRPRDPHGWRVVDIVIAAVLAVVCGLVFWIWNLTGGAYWDVLNSVLPGFAGLAGGMWLIGGTLGALVIRRPGAALMVELLAAVVSMVPGNKWGYTTLYSGLAQGIGAELVFALFRYRNWSLPVAVLAGVAAAAVEWVQEYYVGNHGYGLPWNLAYLVFLAVSGAVIAGVLVWNLVNSLAPTGALDRFESGRTRQTR